MLSAAILSSDRQRLSLEESLTTCTLNVHYGYTTKTVWNMQDVDLN